MPNDLTAFNGGLNDEEVTMVRRALLIGLGSYGEIQRLRNAVELCKMAGESVPREMHPIDPTGSAHTICEFSEALRAMEHAEVTHG